MDSRQGSRKVYLLLHALAVESYAFQQNTEEDLAMARKVFLVSVFLTCVGLLSSKFLAAPPKPVDSQQAVFQDDLDTLVLDDLDEKHDGEDVTIQCTVRKIVGVSQLHVKGQAQTFVIETESGTQKRELTLWVEGELANMLDRFQMSFWQENGLKAGAKLIVKGILRVNPIFLNVNHASTEQPYYRIVMNQWQNFRVVPTCATK